MFLAVIKHDYPYFQRKIFVFMNYFLERPIFNKKIEKEDIIEEYKTTIIFEYYMTTYTESLIKERFFTKSAIEFEKFVFEKYSYKRIGYSKFEIGNALILETRPPEIQIKIF
jgi:hypothetical protein